MSLDVRLTRHSTSDQGTLGSLYIGKEWFGCRTIELPWRDNEPFHSCIPEGEYPITPYESQTFGKTYLVLEVPGRSGILFHAGNWAGDERKGYRADSAGCILPGKWSGKMAEQKAVMVSRPTQRRLLNALDDREGVLTINWS